VTDVVGFVRDKLGHEPKDPKLFEIALTHKSVGKGEDYERLEFLGDRVLGCVIARAVRAPSERA
jgi:ribonuclease-3